MRIPVELRLPRDEVLPGRAWTAQHHKPQGCAADESHKGGCTSVQLNDRLGTGMLTTLRGKFAFCIYDLTSKRALAAGCERSCVFGARPDG